MIALHSEATVIIVDDNEAVRDSIAILMQSVGLHTRVFASADEFLDTYNDSNAMDCTGCVLLDVRMPGMNGIQLYKEMNRRALTWPVLFITGHGDVPMAVEAMRDGAFDFIQKPFREEEVLQRVQQAIEQDANDRVRDSEHQENAQRLAQLSKREREVLERLMDGQANKVIAIDLDISERTVEQHRARVMEKMQARSLAHLIRMVISTRIQSK
ncbi:MAG: response regulator transcription factor [Oceanococcus sp.]